jgi:hypothetical protein
VGLKGRLIEFGSVNHVFLNESLENAVGRIKDGVREAVWELPKDINISGNCDELDMCCWYRQTRAEYRVLMGKPVCVSSSQYMARAMLFALSA